MSAGGGVGTESEQTDRSQRRIDRLHTRPVRVPHCDCFRVRRNSEARTHANTPLNTPSRITMTMRPSRLRRRQPHAGHARLAHVEACVILLEEDVAEDGADATERSGEAHDAREADRLAGGGGDLDEEIVAAQLEGLAAERHGERGQRGGVGADM